MARCTFGGGAADFVMAAAKSGYVLLSAATLYAWPTQVGGAQIIDLQLADGTPTTTIPVGGDGQVPVFKGPNDGTSELWVSAGPSGTRVRLTSGISSATDVVVSGLVTPGSGSATAASLAATYAPTSGNQYLPSPTGVAATDSAALANAITAANTGLAKKVIIAMGGTYAINTLHVIPDGVDLRGQGGGSTSRTGRTIFKCTTAGSGIGVVGGGGMSGHFEVEGDHVANTPFQRAGGTGANARMFENITVRHNTGAYPLSSFVGAQNDIWIQCGFEESSQDLGYFDQGYGGAMFLRCEWAGASRYHHYYDDAITSPTYPVPADIHHVGGIMERGSGVSLVATGAAIANITYSDFAFYSETGCSGPMFDLAAGSGIALHNPWFQSTGSTRIAGTVGLMVRGTASVTVSGRAIFQNLDNAIQVDGVGSFVYNKSSLLFYNCGTQFSGINSGTAAQISDLVLTSTTRVGASTDFAEICQPTARDRFLFSRTFGGVLNWYPGTAGNFTPDVQILRRAAGCVGVPNGTQYMLATGSGTTAQRPAGAIALKGALYANTDTGKVEWYDGSAWKNTSDSAWTNPTVTNATLNPQSASYDAVGYRLNSDGDVIMRGVIGTVTLNATLWTFPAGYRPLKTKVIDVVTMNGSGVAAPGIATIDSSGVVKLTNGSATLVSFDGKRFRAEA